MTTYPLHIDLGDGGFVDCDVTPDIATSLKTPNMTDAAAIAFTDAGGVFRRIYTRHIRSLTIKAAIQQEAK